MNESIEKVIERCEYRMERSLDCNVSDIRRLIEEVRRQTVKPNQAALPLWHGLGNGD